MSAMPKLASVARGLAQVAQAERTVRRGHLTEMTLMLLTTFAHHWATGVTMEQACQQANCVRSELQPAFDELINANYIRKGVHGYIAGEMLRGLVTGMLDSSVRGVH